jgi:hypothetical protein
LLLIESSKFLRNPHPLTALSRGGFSLGSVQTNFQGEKHMESTNHNGRLVGGGQLVTCRLDELRPHPSYVRHNLTIPASQLSALADRGDRAFLEPLMITQDRTILDGYARFELARLQKRTTLPCIAYELTESEALHWLLQKHRRSNGLNDFTRILLALELEPWLKEKARSNQRAGGRQKGSSKLTEAGRLDVRSEIAATAGVSVGNVTKVKQLQVTAHSELLQALRSREISIHRAWLWSKKPRVQQLTELRQHRDNRATNKIKRLTARHKPKSVTVPLDPAGVFKRLARLDSKELAALSVAVLKGFGKAIYLTEDLLQSLPSHQEQVPI